MGCSTDDEPTVAPPANLLGLWTLTEARTIVNSDPVTRSLLRQYFTEQGKSVSAQELDELEGLLREPITGEFNDSTLVDIQPGGEVFFRYPRPQNVTQSTWQYQEGGQLVFFEGTTPLRLTVVSLTDTTMVLLLNPDRYLRYSRLADERPEGMHLEYTLMKQ